jgi:hypothetical protein
MSKIRLYLDEDVDENLATALVREGFDVITTKEVGNKENPDDLQVNYAVGQERAILTHNARDFVPLAIKLMEESYQHYGIVIAPKWPFRKLLREARSFLQDKAAEEIFNVTLYLR